MHNKVNYVAPEFCNPSFNCSHCGAFSHMQWVHRAASLHDHTGSLTEAGARSRAANKEKQCISSSTCAHCKRSSIWIDGILIYPSVFAGPRASTDMPADVIKLYDEAASISSLSPRAAAALLRLAVQLLLPHLGCDGKNINDDIKKLVNNGLNPRIQQALDVLRVTGNNAVHPGTIDTDDPKVVTKLFAVLNLIVEQMITQPNELQTMFEGLPEQARQAIEKRDNKTGTDTSSS